MEIICPKCEHKFNWEPPEDTTIYKMLTKDADKVGSKRYVATCPKCKARLSIRV